MWLTCWLVYNLSDCLTLQMWHRDLDLCFHLVSFLQPKQKCCVIEEFPELERKQHPLFLEPRPFSVCWDLLKDFDVFLLTDKHEKTSESILKTPIFRPGSVITKPMYCCAELRLLWQLLFTALTLPPVLPGGSETAWRGSWHILLQSLSWNTKTTMWKMWRAVLPGSREDRNCFSEVVKML